MEGVDTTEGASPLSRVALILGGAIANVGNWLLTHAVVDFLVTPWATVNLADLLIVAGAAVICAGWCRRVVSHLWRRPCGRSLLTVHMSSPFRSEGCPFRSS
jgi:Signal peptidase (SPase) II